MTSVGFGLALDPCVLDRCATRWRLVARNKFGPDIAGWSVGLAVSF